LDLESKSTGESGQESPCDGVNKLGQAPRHTADSLCFRVDRSEPVPLIHSLCGNSDMAADDILDEIATIPHLNDSAAD
jgi:hypothetical protein